jgi:putative NADH-flavin reductase
LEKKTVRIVILGATGGTGIEMVRRSLAAGHSITAFVRKADALQEFRERIQIKSGDPLSEGELARVLEGYDAVLSGFGPRLPISKSDAHLLRHFARTLTAAMKLVAVRRAIIISTAFLFRDSIIPPTYLLGKLLFPSVVEDSAGLESIIQSSSLDWTIVRPPRLTNLPFTGKYRERIGHLPRFGFKISRADVADYFVRNLVNPSVVRRIVGISN